MNWANLVSSVIVVALIAGFMIWAYHEMILRSNASRSVLRIETKLNEILLTLKKIQETEKHLQE